MGEEGKSGFDGKRLDKGGLRRHRKVARDSIRGITKGDIRRLTRRDGMRRDFAKEVFLRLQKGILYGVRLRVSTNDWKQGTVLLPLWLVISASIRHRIHPALVDGYLPFAYLPSCPRIPREIS